MERSANVSDVDADMNDNRISDESIVPAKQTNNDATEALAESVEERDSTKRNDVQSALPRTQCRNNSKSSRLCGVRGATLSRPTQGRSRMR